ncbi:3191_t:CDS:1 [Scutellospora calospora]|uniref:3191_t:CDS:1 n=1 Tax=Scutellospora calospora TaxID=85575 RepID=A0ACA9K5H1_9GLOM|nr:3191_t:CDS:1 [Scutellospora calospora]
MSTSSNNSHNTPEECSEEEALQIQLDDDIYISDLDDDNIEIEQDDEEIIQSIQDLSLEEITTINEEDLNKNLELSQQLKLVVKAESDVWKHVNKETRKCSYCSKIFAPTTATSSIRSHLQSQHKTLLNKEQLNFVIKKYSSEIQMEKTQAIFEWIILALKPFNVVENKAFQNMIKKLDPFYQVPKRKAIYNLAISQFYEQRNLIKNYLSNIISKVALTADFWTSLKMESFLAITIHFIDKNWNLQHFVLDIFQFKGSHTGEIIADKIYNLLEEFEIETKVISLTTDNGANMISAANYLQDKLNSNNFCHYRCIAHILNLVVLAGLNNLENPIKKLRKLIKTIRKSTKIFEDLKNIETLDKQSFLAPILDCKTRWNSTYHMIKRACLLNESIEISLIKHPNLKTYMPNKEEWKIYESLVHLLEQFNEATIELSSQSYPTIAHAQIILLALRKI